MIIDEPNTSSTPSSNSTSNSTVVEDKAPMAPLMLDLVFISDCTGSMGSYIASAQGNIRSIATKIVQSEKCDVRFGLVCYRDHPPQDSTFVTRVFPFTASVDQMKKNVDWMAASGGGDGPEAVADGLHEALHLPYRPNATKFVVLIADAPPHGLGESGDGFPNGCPDGHDPIKIAREMALNGITLYAVGCEPALASYRHARTFLKSIADITGGQAINLGSSALLADLIMGGAQEEIALEMLMDDVQKEIEAEEPELDASKYTEDVSKDIASRVAKKLQTRGVRAKQLECDGYLEASHNYYKEAKSLHDAADRMKKDGVFESAPAPAPGGAYARFDEAAGFSDFAYAMPSRSSAAPAPPPAVSAPSSYMRVKEDVVSVQQVERMVQKTAARKGWGM
eukprot:TRINITY_DN1075_c0_g1::TRINITY_DN1075_c0_g1_i1::g.29978::m.29978 TRINITY_DN1075_c0_g1::TRINITY_DN1075_c0_g1_i1::g.29978  ORF type:complete len:429 (-),score=91.10,sp/Q6B9X6/VWKA_DICDI/35.86/5e-17,VWA_2/PF13519.1/2.4e-13,VWA/PF00092.23/2e-08,Med25_VWA/PF11265.3/0.0072,OmpA/PF00691.15/0.048 TRINITY_DN1075_c0_g1_i1:337-1521(-)